MAGEALLTRALDGVSAAISKSVDRRVEAWHSTYVTPEAAIADPRLPGLGDRHPNNAELFLDTIDFRSLEDGSVQPVLYYSTDGSFEILENTKQTTSDDPRVAMNSREFKVHIPAVSITKKVLEGGEIYLWEELPAAATQFEEIRPLMIYRCVVPALSFSSIRLILNQVHKVHQFDGPTGPKFEFLNPTINPQGDKDSITYYWQYDEGTPLDPNIPGMGTTVIYPNFGEYARKPYHKTIITEYFSAPPNSADRKSVV